MLPFPLITSLYTPNRPAKAHPCPSRVDSHKVAKLCPNWWDLPTDLLAATSRRKAASLYTPPVLPLTALLDPPSPVNPSLSIRMFPFFLRPREVFILEAQTHVSLQVHKARRKYVRDELNKMN